MSDAGSSPTSTVVSPTSPSARTSSATRARIALRECLAVHQGRSHPRLEPIRSGPLIALVFSYEVSDAAEFERVYGPDGEWAEFFRGGRGYIGTELLRDLEHPGRYLVIDRWESAQAYDAFVAENRDEYMRRVDETAFLYQQELRFGTFESVWA